MVGGRTTIGWAHEEGLRLLERALSYTQNGVMITDATEPDDPIIYVNRAFERITGYASEEAVGRNPRFLQAGDSDQPALDDLRTGREAHKDDVEWTGVLRNYKKDGTLFYNELSAAAVRDEEGRVTHHIGVISDVTKRERAEERVRYQARLLGAVGQAVVAVDLSGRVVYWNPAAERLFGWSSEEAVGRSVGEVVVSEDRPGRAEEIWDELAAGRGWSGEFVVRRRDGTAFPVMVTDTPVFDERGELVGTIGVSTDLTERKRAEEALKASEASLAEAQRIAGLGSWEWDVRTDRASWSDEAYRIHGYAPGSFVPTLDGLLRTVHPEDRREVGDRIKGALYGGEAYDFEHRVVRPDGEARVVHRRGEILRDADGAPLRVVGTVHDVTERRRAEERLEEAEERYRTLVERVPPVIYVQKPAPEKDGPYDVTYMSPRAESVLGHAAERFVEDPGFWNRVIHAEDLEAVVAEDVRTEQTGEAFLTEYRIIRGDGRTVWVRDEAVLIRGERGEALYWQGVLSDVTERKMLEQRLEHLALHDPLTGLPNRALFSDRLEQALKRAERDRERIAVLFMDLDDFKDVNDSLGHEAGDELLIRVAERLGGCVRPGDTAARLGGDEFVVLLEGLAGGDEAFGVAGRIKEALREPFALGEAERRVFVTASAGVAFGGPEAKKGPGELLREADVAMYAAKRRGKDRHEAFEEAMDVPARERLEARTELGRALERGELTIRYQPKVDLESDEIVCMEALAYWEHPRRGLLPPGEFVPLAEETGLIVSLGLWVIRQSCRQVREWQVLHPDEPPLTLSANLSARQFEDEGLARDIAKVLKESGLEASHLILEITENAVMRDAPLTTRIMRELKSLGVELSVDDFGTGYSSLSYLRRFPVDYLKIDRSFVEGLEEDPGDTVVASGIISLAHAMNLKVVAEGVETEGQLRLLREMACDMAQGYLFSKPLTTEGAAALLTDARRRRER